MDETWSKGIHFPFHLTTQNNFWSKSSKMGQSGWMQPPCWIEPSSGLPNDVGGSKERREAASDSKKNRVDLRLYRTMRLYSAKVSIIEMCNVELLGENCLLLLNFQRLFAIQKEFLQVEVLAQNTIIFSHSQINSIYVHGQN